MTGQDMDVGVEHDLSAGGFAEMLDRDAVGPERFHHRVRHLLDRGHDG